jgi:hypothetical protein
LSVGPRWSGTPKFGSRKEDAMRIAQINVEEKGGLPPPMSKGGCHGA